MKITKFSATILFSVGLILPVSAIADSVPPELMSGLNSPNYLSGPALRHIVTTSIQAPDSTSCFKEDDRGEHGFVKVPLDYADPSQGTLLVYYHLDHKFDPSLPSMIFFTGGPGGDSACVGLGDSITEYNVIMFDQRGIGFSRPNTLNDLINIQFYSTSNTIKDALSIIDHFNLQKVSLWGHSYGTILATEFASRYPGRTKAVILEGTIFDGKNLSKGEHRIKLLQYYFDHLSPVLRKKILDLSDSPLAPPSWFSELVVGQMTSPTYISTTGHNVNVFSIIDKELSRIFAKDDISDQAHVLEETFGIKNGSHPSDFEMDTLLFSGTQYLQIGCKELDLYGDHVTPYSVFNGNKLVPMDASLADDCDKFARMRDIAKAPYQAVQFPISVPVTYFQGVLDGQTPADNAVHHYNQVPLNNRQLILFQNEEHGPVIYHLAYKLYHPIRTDLKKQALHNLALRALAGEPITPNLLSDASDAGKNTGIEGDKTILNYLARWSH